MAAESNAGPWRVEREGAVAVASYHEPPMNYLTGRGLAQLGELIPTWADEEIRAVVLTGGVAGRFITHFSVEELLEGQPRMAARGPELNYRVHAVYQALNDLPKPVIAAMNGDTMGAGFELALSSDIRIAQRGDYRFGLPEIRLGLIPGATGTQRMARLLGASAALNVILRAELQTPEEALALGTVHELADDAGAAGRALAARLATMPPAAIASAKRSIYQGSDLPLASALRMEADASFRAKLAPESTRAMEEYVAVPLERRRAWLDQGREPSVDQRPGGRPAGEKPTKR
jgi:enoyl-CoA hydratase